MLILVYECIHQIVVTAHFHSGGMLTTDGEKVEGRGEGQGFTQVKLNDSTSTTSTQMKGKSWMKEIVVKPPYDTVKA